jgi:uncharacterized protein (DUF433 family)
MLYLPPMRTRAKKDVLELPAYTVREAAHYLTIPLATMRSWSAGRRYPTKAGNRFFRSVLGLPKTSPPVLSFTNLVEAHVLDAIRRKHQISLDKIRLAIKYLREEFGSEHPLADHRLETDGLDLFVQEYGRLINITRSGQMAIRELLEGYLKRIERNSAGSAIRLYPFTRKRGMDEPRLVVIDPAISFGRPVLARTGIPTAAIAERYKAGESVPTLATDYGRSSEEIEEAIRCELQLEAA